MEIAELLKGLKKYKEILNEAYLEIRLFDDGSGIIVNEDKKNIYCFDTAEEALQDLFECKNCKCYGNGVRATGEMPILHSFLSFLRKLFLSLIFLIYTVQLFNINSNSIDLSEDYISFYKESVQWDLLYNSIVMIESRGDNYAISSKGAIGQMQSLPKGKGGYLDEANRILGFNKYETVDLHSPIKSRQIWDIVMKHHNPEKSINKAIKMHNPKAGDWYKQRILRVYNKLIEEYNQKINNYVKKRS